MLVVHCRGGPRVNCGAASASPPGPWTLGSDKCGVILSTSERGSENWPLEGRGLARMQEAPISASNSNGVKLPCHAALASSPQQIVWPHLIRKLKSRAREHNIK